MSTTSELGHLAVPIYFFHDGKTRPSDFRTRISRSRVLNLPLRHSGWAICRTDPDNSPVQLFEILAELSDGTWGEAVSVFV